VGATQVVVLSAGLPPPWEDIAPDCIFVDTGRIDPIVGSSDQLSITVEAFYLRVTAGHRKNPEIHRKCTVNGGPRQSACRYFNRRRRSRLSCCGRRLTSSARGEVMSGDTNVDVVQGALQVPTSPRRSSAHCRSMMTVAVFRVVRGTMRQHLDAFGIRGKGQEVTFRVTDIFALRNGKIAGYWEVAGHAIPCSARRFGDEVRCSS
jgi:hypothetical protein